ncbi:MAG TPA: hypothetical protein DCQ42_09855 [Halomonas sp.]|jgi:transposase InsO family protein|uniref:integrase core domain-containing protein n=1 Tax=Halomonadaceae TaxID=28256 RepID=UPI000ACF8B44|nr:hypothetical protein [Halomonas sp.]
MRVIQGPLRPRWLPLARLFRRYYGVQFAKKAGTEAYKPHIFDVVCYRHGIEHRLTKPFHPWTNGQVERMNRTIKEATTRAFHYTSLSQLQSHLEDYLWAYNNARPLRALKGKTLIGFILEQWQKEPEKFYDDPNHYFTGPNNYALSEKDVLLAFPPSGLEV